MIVEYDPNTDGSVRIFDTKRKKSRIRKSINMKQIQSYYLKEFVSHHWHIYNYMSNFLFYYCNFTHLSI